MPNDTVLISNLQEVPPAITMPIHIATSNPHPQYVRVDGLAEAIKGNICMSDLKDVNINGTQADNTILVFNGGTYSPITLTALGQTIEIPYATTATPGVIRVATTIYETDTVAVTPLMLRAYVDANSYTLSPATDNDIGGVTLYQISSIASNIVDASTFNLSSATTDRLGGVYLATVDEAKSGTDTSKAVTPECLVTTINSAIATISGYTLPVATTDNLGGVKVIETDHPAGRSKIADLITSIHVAGNTDLIVSYVPQIQYNQFVNVHILKYPDTEWEQIGYYKTHPNAISADDDAETAFIADIQYQNLNYLIYSNGVLSNRTSYDPTIAANAHDHVEIHVLENGAAYDINTYGKVIIHQEGNIKRWVVNSDCVGYVQGIAHNVNISAENANAWGANLHVYNHGHVEYVTVEGTGQLICGDHVYEKFKSALEPNTTYYEWDNTNNKYVVTQDTVRSPGKTYYIKNPSDAIVENVTVCNGLSAYAGLQISATGKGYNIVLVNSASAYIYGYAKDVIVHSGCCLFIKDTVEDSVVTATAKIDNLVLYTGATIFVDDGAEINGCILHPGVVINPQYPKATIHYDTCRETEHPVWIITKRDIHYYHDTEKNSDFTVNYYTYKDISGNMITSTALLPQQVAFLEPSGTPLVHHFVAGNTSDGHTVSNRIYVWAIDMPKGLYRSDLLAEENYKAIAAEGITDENAPAYTSYLEAAYKFYDLQVASYGRTGVGLTNYYALQLTSTVVDDLTTSSERFKGNVIF